MDEARKWQQSAEKHNTAAASPWSSEWLTKLDKINRETKRKGKDKETDI